LTSKYQVIALGGSRDRKAATLFSTLKRRVDDLGLSSNEHVVFIEDPSVSTIDTGKAPTAAVFFGGVSRTTGIDDAATLLRDRGVFVLPVVPDIKRYNTFVPPSLSGINGIEQNAGDPAMETIAQRVLEELRLVRERRLVFISYRRDESAAVAEQLYRTFDERSFDVFLDTHSVRGGVEFQSILWDRMADADLLVLIDSPRALSSRWVSEELARAQVLGLGVLQLIWPGHTRTAGTEFCEAMHIETSDFDSASSDNRLTAAKLQSIVSTAEGLRARSLAARHARIVEDILKRARRVGCTAIRQPALCVEIESPQQQKYLLFPVVGHPDSIQIYRCHENCSGPAAGGVLLYDPLGMLPPKRLHLGWLNGFLPLKAVAVTELDEWFRAIA
jgi:hypothetical protein